MMDHHVIVCAEHGNMLSQCRCPSPHKQRIQRPCPGRICPGFGKAKMIPVQGDDTWPAVWECPDGHACRHDCQTDCQALNGGTRTNKRTQPPATGYLDLLDQDEMWRPRGSSDIKLTDMDVHHRANLVQFLERKAEAFQRAAYSRFIMSEPDDPSDGVFWALQAEEQQYHKPALEWMREKPLYRKLVELDTRGPVGRQITEVRNRGFRIKRAWQGG